MIISKEKIRKRAVKERVEGKRPRGRHWNTFGSMISK